MAGAILAGALTGCVSKKKYNELAALHQQMSQDYTTIQANYAQEQTKSKTVQALLDEARRNNADLKSQYSALQSSLDKSISQNTQGNVNISKLVDEINASNKYIKQLVQAKSKSDSLNLALSTNLTRSLSGSETDEVNVRVIKGVVYISLADNMLFKSGSYEVNSRAMQTLSVVQVLQNDFGVDPSRLTAGGRGEYNPIADNDSELGRQRNRRTEIIITPKLDQFLDLIDKAPDSK